MMHIEAASEIAESGAEACSRAKKAYEPRPSRYAAHQLLWLVREDGSVSCATMINVSRDGFGLRVSSPPARGEHVMLRGGAGDIPAGIRWSTADRAGGLFMLPEDDSD
jgi:hypothetical protein